MDGINLELPGQGDDTGDVEIVANRLAGFADRIGFIGLEAMQSKAIFVGINRHGADTEFRGGTEDANGNLAAVGHEQLANGRQGSLWFFRHGGQSHNLDQH